MIWTIFGVKCKFNTSSLTFPISLRCYETEHWAWQCEHCKFTNSTSCATGFIRYPLDFFTARLVARYFSAGDKQEEQKEGDVPPEHTEEKLEHFLTIADGGMTQQPMKISLMTVSYYPLNNSVIRRRNDPFFFFSFGKDSDNAAMTGSSEGIRTQLLEPEHDDDFTHSIQKLMINWCKIL